MYIYDINCFDKSIDEIKQIIISFDVNKMDTSRFTPLMNVIYYANMYNFSDIMDIIQFVLDSGADINFKHPNILGYDYYSALHVAINEDIRLSILLLFNGANTMNKHDLDIIKNRYPIHYDLINNFKPYLLLLYTKQIYYGENEIKHSILGDMAYCLIVCILGNMMEQ